MIQRFIDRVFAREDLNGAEECPTYMTRWRLLGWGRGEPCRFRIYLHHFVGDDWTHDPHDHPKRFISIGLAGEYWEEVFSRAGFGADTIAPLSGWSVRHWRAPWFRTFEATHIHRIRIHPEPPEKRTRRKPGAWTICIVLRTTRDWGFFYERRFWMPWRYFVYGGPGRERKSC